MKTLENLLPEEYINYSGLLSENQKNELDGQEYTESSLFNPIQDANDNWVISIQEMIFCTIEEFQWVKNIPIIEFNKKPDGQLLSDMFS